MSARTAADEFEIGLKLSGRVRADSMDEAAARVLRELEPRLEVWLGLQGVTAVRYSGEHAMRPLEP